MPCRDPLARLSDSAIVSRASWAFGLALAIPALPAAAAPTNPNELMNPLVPAEDCNYCHSFANQQDLFDQRPYSPQAGWTPSLMANAAKDPVFWAAVAVAAQDDKGAETEDCIRCHSPNAFLSGRASATAIDELLEEDLGGVTCESCHRMTAEGELGNARYSIDDELVGDTVARRGPWDYSDGVPQPVPGVEGHATMFDAFTGSSELCGTCHDVTTGRERVDDAGAGMGMDFNEQRTYSEWAGSAFAQQGDDFRSCQDCHMPEIPDSAGCGTYTDVHQHPLGNRRHDLMGANRFMLQLLAEDATPGFEAAMFDIAITAMDEFVQSAATLEVQAPETVDLGAGIAGLEVTVTNQTGHKLPSGYSEGRVMWLEVVARYGDVVVASSGLWSQETGTIQDDAQARRYEGLAENLATGTRNHLLLNDYWRSDTRIPPRGLVPNIETDPVGDRYAMTPEGAWAHWDEVAYAFEAVPEIGDTTPDDMNDDQLDIDVRLLYLINTPDYIQQLADDNTTSEVGVELAGRFEALGGATPVVLAQQQLSVPIVGFGGSADSGSTSETPTTSSGSAVTNPDTQGDATQSGSASVTGSTSVETDDAGADDSGDGGSCSCSTEGSGGTPAALLLLLGFVRRRRVSVAARLARRRSTPTALT